ncbi:hypothetical protein DB44_CW00060 [Candidatus Protochlamydia amoebophila]|uniref:Uncharacterized protein n=2 Tax=Candidatus Protochlamydia amoebophila TaxID=362787 RepID=A0A0C1HAH4_9BACT|nr:hypothetical protein DB44_CW00060 [Candidatus Protochlamydia amoebophila]
MRSFMNNKRIFISGGAGVIGTALVNSLLKEKVSLFVGDLKPCPKEWLGKLKYWQGDLNAIHPEILQNFDPDIFFHLAATFERSEETYSFFLENFHHNVRLSHYLINLLKDGLSLKKVIFASSYLIYDPTQYQFTSKQEQVSILNEESRIYPRNICGGAKLLHELELRFLNHFLGHQASFISARIFRVYGYQSKDVISRWIRSAIRGEPLTVYRPEGQFDYIFSDDVAEALLKLSQTEHSGVVNVGSGEARSVQTILDLLHQYFPNLQVQPSHQNILFEHSQANIDRLEQWIKWRPENRLEQAIPKLIEFEKQKWEAPIFHEDTCSILITSISKKMPLIEAVREAARKTGQIKSIHGCDADVNCIGKYGVDQFWHCPSLSHLTIEEVIAYCKEYFIKMIIPTRDGDLLFFAQYKSLLQAEGIQIMCSSLDTVLICQDKKKFAEFLLEHHFQPILTSVKLDDIDSVHYVVKERKGAGSLKMLLKVSKDEAMQGALKLDNPIFQPYMIGKEWSIDLYRSAEGKVQGCVARLRNYTVGGESQITTTTNYPELENYCIDIANQLNVSGHAIFQVIVDEFSQFHVIECNPRFGGASTASLAVGLDSFFWFFLESLGENLQSYPFNRSKHEIRQIRYPADRIIPWSSSLT